MKKAIFGLHLTGVTALSIAARTRSVRSAVLTISTRVGQSQRISGTGEWKVALPAGDHIIQLDGDIDGPIDVSVNPGAVFVSLAGPSSNLLTSWPSGGATTSDVKDPWPPPIVAGPHAPTLATGLADADAATWFNTVLAPMANTIGRGGVEDPPIHALVIGIDDYPEAAPPNRTLFRSLGGCVRDALEVVAFLRDRLGVPPSQITQLLAPLPGVDVQGAALPTYDNIVRAWQRLIDEVPRGEQIYIHYSGHGGRVKTCLPEIKGATARDEALAPCDVNQRDTGRFLRDVEVALLLERMAQRGQVGTIVVDACHSGGLPRGDAVPRGGPEDLEPRPSDELGSAVGTRAELEATAQRSAGSRGAGEPWNFGASSTAVVAACRQNEFAYEYAFDGHTRRGALTYFWLAALDRRGASLTYGAATRRIDAEITAHQLAQRPMVIGDADREILGLDHVRSVRAIPVQAVDGDRITLSAGMATLMRRGMRLAIAPPDAAANAIELAGLPEVEITEVDADISIARRVGDNPGEIVGGAQAIPLRYTDSVTRFVKWLPSGLPGDDDARRTFAEALAADGTKLVAAAPDGVAAQFSVTVTTAGGTLAYRIDDASGAPVAKLGAAISVADSGAAACVVARLAHLARYGTVQTLDNSDSRSPLTGCLELELLALPDDFQQGDRIVARPFPGAQPDRLLHNTWFCLRIRNRSPFELNAVVLDLQADWGISKAVPSNMPWIQLAPDGFHDTAIRAWVPDGQDATSDTLKAIATMEPTSFDWLCLDPIDQIDDPHRARKGMQSNDLGSAMEAMRSTTRSTRNVSEANVPTRAWTTVQRVITVEAEAQRDKGAA